MLKKEDSELNKGKRNSYFKDFLLDEGGDTDAIESTILLAGIIGVVLALVALLN